MQHKLLKLLGVVLGIVAVFYIIQNISDSPGSNIKGGKAPEGSFEKRKAWAKETFDSWWPGIIKWVQEAELISRDIGIVKDIAPIGGPNYFWPAEEGIPTHIYARLEVIGEKGTGIVILPFFQLHDDYEKKLNGEYILKGKKIAEIGDNARWIFNNKEEIITLSGKSYLKEMGWENSYKHLEENYNNQEYARFIENFDSFNKIFSSKDENFLHGVHLKYKAPLLLMYARSLAHNNLTEQALKIYHQIAKDYERQRFVFINLIINANNITRANGERIIDVNVSDQDIQFIRSALKEAYDLDPKNPMTIFYAKRLIFSERNIKYANIETKYGSEEWAEKEYGIFYDEAKKIIKKSPTISNEIGSIFLKIRPSEYHMGYVSISDGYYEASVILEIEGMYKKGKVEIDLKEDKDNLPRVDIFAKGPRQPSFPIQVKRAYLYRETENGEEKTKLKLN